MNEPTGQPDDPRSDEALIGDLGRGDESAFAALYFRYRDWVVRLAYRFTGSHDDALDVLQETFAYLLRKATGMHLSARMATFLYPVVKNLSLAIRRKRRPSLADERVFAELPAPAQEAGTRSRAELEALLAKLPEAQREVILMRFVDGMSLEGIAQAMGVPLGTVKSRLHNGISTLRQAEGMRDALA